MAPMALSPARPASGSASEPASCTVLVLQHATWEEPGLIARAVAQRGITLDVRSVADSPAPDLPDLADLAGVLVMGGPMGALDDADHPGLAAERDLIARAHAAGIPVLGVCLGMQLLAVALGGALETGVAREIGFAPVELTGHGLRDPYLYPLAVDADADPVVLHWHDDRVEAPAGAQVLASTPLTPVQAFRAGNSVGLQFHLEVDGPLLRDWLGRPEMTGGLRESAVETILADSRERFTSLVPRALVTFSTFADAVLAHHRASRG